MRKTLIISLLCFAMILSACQSTGTALPSVEVVGQIVTVDGGSCTDVTPTELQTMLASKDFTFVNVHIPFEGNIAATDLSIPYDQVSQNLDQLPADNSARVVLYCRRGRRR